MKSRQKATRVVPAIRRIKIYRPLIANADHVASKPDDCYGHQVAYGDGPNFGDVPK
jgi:hypothetical protein